METNNQDAPAIEGQGNEAGKTEVVEETTEPVGTEETEGKGKPNDPELMRAKMTQSDQKAAKAIKDLDAMKDKMGKLAKDPRFEKIYKEVVEGKEPEAKEEKGLKRDQMNDQQKQIYGSMKEYMSIYLEEIGMTPKEFKAMKQGTEQDRQDSANKTMYDNFIIAHPEAKDDTVNKALADIINAGAKRGERIGPETALEIHNARSGKVVAKKTTTDEDDLEAKIGASLLKPRSTNVEGKAKGKPSKRQAILEAMDSTPE